MVVNSPKQNYVNAAADCVNKGGILTDITRLSYAADYSKKIDRFTSDKVISNTEKWFSFVKQSP